MVILIGGDTHTGKTLLAQQLLEKYQYPYLSIDHLKMGLIRSGHCNLSPECSDTELTEFLWPIIREMIKTCIENSQNIIIEGCYIPFDWTNDFAHEYIQHIKYVCLILSKQYIRNHYQDILKFENVIEKRLHTELDQEELYKANEYNLRQCQLYNHRYILVEDDYIIDIDKI